MSRQCEPGIKDERFAIIDQILARNGKSESMLIQNLEQIQHELGYLPEDIQSYLAEAMAMPLSKIYGVVTFYSLFTTEKIGKYKISVCLGTACYVKGSGEIMAEFERQLGIKTGQTTEDGRFTLEACRCLGACGLAPVLTVNGKVFGRLSTDDVAGIIAQFH
ncbi:MAG: NAD(P)H-dependent oxidoreductase subunit E [Peptococcaceae bacterium]|jgi:NADH:ubiquinone oxidoreductase subunit E|nr:NAD(P)H-dependent oxidoreductase subunit E [Peptococcaceae bacterium]